MTAGSDSRLATAAFAGSAALSAVVLFVPAAPGPGLVEFPGADKVVHAVVFALLGATSRVRFGAHHAAAVALVAYAAFSEVAQAVWLPARAGDVVDLVADLVGGSVGWWTARAWHRARTGSVPATSRPE